MKALIPNRTLFFAFALVLLASLALVFLDGKQASLQGWLAYALILGAGLGLIYGTWLWIDSEGPPRTVLIAAVMAMTVRIVLGLILMRALPEYGYDQIAQRDGYVSYDAYKRDTDAWARSKSDQPLLNGFTSPKESDQYGGYLFLSSAVYRYLSPDAHRPMLMTSVGAAVAGIGILFSWVFIRYYFGAKAAAIGTWIMALYPEAVFWGSSQMREPLLITALAGALASYTLWLRGHRKRSLLLAALMIFFLSLPISPPFVVILLLTVGLAWVWDQEIDLRRSLPFIVLALFVAFISVYLAARSWVTLRGIHGSVWQIIRGWWEHTGGGWRVTLVADQSFNLDVLLLRIPAWSRLPFLVLFGLVQPFLPAALIAPGATIWRLIGVFRASGWFLMLPFLLYAPIYALRRMGWRHISTYMSIYVWIAALAASYRAPSYQWDNPRYRVVYLVIQVALISWLWIKRSEARDPWVVRLGWAILAFNLIVAHWYVGSVFDTPRLGLPTTMLLAVAAGVIIPLTGILRDYLQAKRMPGTSVEV